MENLSDPQTLYQDILQTAFEKLRKTLPKKYKETHETISTFFDQLKHDKERNANQYFGVFKECIETKDAKLIETSIYYIHKLISHGFLDGNCRDFTTNAEREENRNNADSTQERLLIDSIVESVCSCRGEKTENVQVQLIKVLLTLMTSSTYEVHGASLQEIIHTLFTIHLTSKSSINQTTAKAALQQIINAIFKRMEEHNAQSEQQGNRIRDNGVFNFSNMARDSQSRSSIDMSPQPNRLSLNPYPTLSPVASNASLSNTIARSGQRYSIIGNPDVQAEGATESTPQERYIYRCLEHVVDDVCIYDERVKELEKEYENKDDNEKIQLREEIAKISLQSVPPRSETNESKYKSLKAVSLENEMGESAGIMGWCFVCRGAANLYCKDTRVPVCSVECKTRHLDELHYLSNMDKKSQVKEKTAYLEDAQKVFIYLCKLSGKDPANGIDATSLKSKTLSLELLVSIMQNPGPMFVTRPEFKEVVKDHLCDSILKNSVSTDKPVFSYSLGTFISLVKHFRDVLRAEIAVFIEDIFLRMLESGNSSFNHRFLALQVFNKICSEEKSLLEFYVNYDCNMNSTNLVEKVIEILCKVAQGKYARIEYSTIVTADQELQLKALALESLVKLVKSLIQFTQEHQAKQDEAARIKKERLAAHVNANEDDNAEFEKEIEDEKNKVEALHKMDDTIEKQRMLKNELQKAIHKFNFKIKLGMKLFAQLGVIDLEDAISVATFFKNNVTNLSKDKLGEYFGDEHPFQIKVLTEFTELIDFKEKTIDDGLRVFLGYFDLPGEGQKIDRIMQVFAGKYYKDNPNSFKSGSAAYTLSFALIMLQTDAHSTNIKEQDKMTLLSFSRMVRGINDGEDLPAEEIAGYFNRILENPLALHAAAKSKKTQQDAKGQNLRRKEEQFRLESEAMIEKGQKLIKIKQEGQYFRINSPEYIRPLFTEIIWSPVLAVYSVLFEHSENPKMIKLALEGLCDAIVLCGLHKMDTELNAFVSTLSKFTNLTGVREIKDKNLLSIQAMLDLGINNGGMLRMAWRYVLDCMSKINYYSNDYAPLGGLPDEHSEAARRKDAVERHISDTIKNNIDFNKVNYIYSKSSVFSLEEILDFITCLCQISEEELKSPNGPSTYSLQKIVEVAHFNVDRVKFVWTQIWNIMKEHITNAAIHSTREISFFAVDSLKQLSIKFLIKEELASLEFQKEFLHPFEVIFQQVANDDLKELILNCCSYIIAHVKKNIRSGWKIIFDILGLAAESPKESIVKLAFTLAEKIINSELESLKDVFADLAVLLIKFAKSPHEKIAIIALKDLSSLINKQSENKEKFAEAAAQSQSTTSPIPTPTPGENKNFSGISDNAWKTLLTALSKLCLEKKRGMSLQATITLFDIFKTYGEYFPREFWKRIFHEVLKPLFEKSESTMTIARKSSISGGVDENKYDNEPLREMFSRLIDMHNYYRPKLDFFTKDLLELLVDCAIQSQEILAKISLNTIRFLINNWHDNFSVREWETCLAAFKEIFDKTLPRQLLNYKTINSANKEDQSQSFNSQECLTHCIVQLQMISLVKDTLEQYGDYFNDEQIYEILKMLQASYKFAKSFNEQKYLRFCLWKDDSMRAMDQLPGLVKQEKEALSAYLLLLFNLYTRKLKQQGEETSSSEKTAHLDDFIELGIDLMKSFYQKNEEYLAIMAHETTKNRESEASPRTADSTSNLSLDEAFKKQTHNIAKQELEREIINIRGIFAQTFLPKLLTVEVPELERRIKDLVKNLVNISFYFVPKELVFGEYVKLNSKIYTKQDEASDIIKKLLSTYFEYSMTRNKKDNQ